MPASPQGAYRDCYVAYLDVLGFKELVQRSIVDAGLLQRLCEIIRPSVRVHSGMKETAGGLVPMQARAFSDHLLLFTPLHGQIGGTPNPNHLAQLLFVVRYIHDQVIRLGACIRGAVTIGQMYWHPRWSNPSVSGRRPDALSIGPGLIDAHLLESKVACFPRIVLGPLVSEHGEHFDAYPFAGRATQLGELFRRDADGQMFLDLLDARVTRRSDEGYVSAPGGFFIRWSSEVSTHAEIRDAVVAIAKRELESTDDQKVREKHEWLLSYANRR